METTTQPGMEPGIDILSTGSGHIEIRFDGKDPMEVERASRIIQDMLKRGYALFIHEGETVVKVQSFDPAKNVYIVADGPLVAGTPEQAQEKTSEPASELTPAEQAAGDAPRKRGRYKKREVKVTEARATAVGRTAGG